MSSSDYPNRYIREGDNMSQNNSTVILERMNGLPAVRVTLEREVASHDVSNAFKLLSTWVAEYPDGLYVVVDLRENPNFPLAANINGTLFGPHRTPNLREWLVIGSHQTARLTERALAAVTGFSNVRWFKNDVEAIAYLNQQAGVPER
jgi:hypothetical protein